MTHNDIIKALSCCITINNNCEECPYEHSKTLSFNCIDKSTADAIDLINRQQAEIESWKRLYENTCTELKEILALESEIKQEAIKEFLEELKKKTVPIMFGNECRKVISEQGIDAIAERMGANNKC